MWQKTFMLAATAMAVLGVSLGNIGYASSVDAPVAQYSNDAEADVGAALADRFAELEVHYRQAGDMEALAALADARMTIEAALSHADKADVGKALAQTTGNVADVSGRLEAIQGSGTSPIGSESASAAVASAVDCGPFVDILCTHYHYDWQPANNCAAYVNLFVTLGYALQHVGSPCVHTNDYGCGPCFCPPSCEVTGPATAETRDAP